LAVQRYEFPVFSQSLGGGNERLRAAAVIGAVCQVIETAIDVGRSAGWWS
jgi:hypothetical protein